MKTLLRVMQSDRHDWRNTLILRHSGLKVFRNVFVFCTLHKFVVVVVVVLCVTGLKNTLLRVVSGNCVSLVGYINL